MGTLSIKFPLTIIALVFSQSAEGCPLITSDSGIDSCIQILYNFNISGVLTRDRGCRLYTHVLKCINGEINNACSLQQIHTEVPDYIKDNHDSIQYDGFDSCSVSDTESYCYDSLGILARGISICGSANQNSLVNCDYMQSVFVEQCYLSFGQAQYFECYEDQLEYGLIKEYNWFLNNWNLNITSCFSGKTDVCRNTLVLNEINVQLCLPLFRYFDFYYRLTSNEKCKHYNYFLLCLKSEVASNLPDQDCELQSLDIWVPGYLHGLSDSYEYRYLYDFHERKCNVTEDDGLGFCNDKRALFLTDYNYCGNYGGQIPEFACGPVVFRYNYYNCFRHKHKAGYISCTDDQIQASLSSEDVFFQNKYTASASKCFANGADIETPVCNNFTTNRYNLYQLILDCVTDHARYFNYSRLLRINGACLLHRYNLNCIKTKLEDRYSLDCELQNIHDWLYEEINSKFTSFNIVKNCSLTPEGIEHDICDDSFTILSRFIGNCYYAYYVNRNFQTQTDHCRYFNRMIQNCYTYRNYPHSSCSYSQIYSAFINEKEWIRNKTQFDISTCFGGCAATDTCCDSNSNSPSCMASNNGSRCHCGNACLQYGNCCPDYNEICACNSDDWENVAYSGCSHFIQSQNNSGLMNDEDYCTLSVHFAKCLQSVQNDHSIKLCPDNILSNKTNAFITERYGPQYTLDDQECNETVVSSFCQDKRALFLLGVNRCPQPNNEIFNCGYFNYLYRSCYSWRYRTNYVNCNSNAFKSALADYSEWFQSMWSIDVLQCSNDNVYICESKSFSRSTIYSLFATCFDDMHTEFNKTGYIDTSGGCRYYSYIIDCVINLGRNSYSYRVFCEPREIHEWFKTEVYEKSEIYHLVHSCTIPVIDTETDSYCNDNDAKFVGLVGITSDASNKLGDNLSEDEPICPIIPDIIQNNINAQPGYFKCTYEELDSALSANSDVLYSYVGESIYDCYERKTTTSTTVITPSRAPASNYTPGAEVYPFGQKSNDDFISGDDRISPSIYIPIGFPSVNRFFDRVYIGTNGIISFSAARNFNPSVPVDFVKLAGVDFIAPFWTDLDARYYLSRVYYHVYDSRNIASDGDNVDTIIKMATKDARYFYNENTFEAKWVLVVTWDKMTPPLLSNEYEVMTFQCVLITDGTSSFVIFRYIYMDWLLVRGRKAAIGYRLFEVKENDLSFDDAIFKVNHYRGNVGVKGFYIYKLTNEKDEAENSRKICYDWYDYYKKIESITQAASKVIDRRRYDCPCSLKSIWYDWRWLRVKSPVAGVSCYSLFANRILPNTRTCCYNIFYGTYIRLQPSAGTFNLYHPIFAPRHYINEDLNPKQHCCYKTNLCSLYYSIRPIGSCYGSPPFAFRWFFGDPHIEMLDGNQYTFNGLGEYWLMKYESENETFELQARTDLIVNENGTYSNATIFSAFAAREANTTFQVELSTDRKQLIIYANGQDYTTQYNNNHDFMVIDTRIIMSRQNDTLVVIFGITGLQLNVTLGIRMLTFSTTVPEDFSGKTIGLVGNFDGNMNNDFILPNGTVLGKDETDTERKIFYNFGIHWTINAADSLFNYTKGKSADDYAHPEFIPVFIDEFPEEDVNKSREICGGKSASTACIFDFLLTKDENVGISSGRVDSEASETVKASDNKIPEISGTLRVNATVGMPVEIHVNGSDDGNFTYDVISETSSNLVFNEAENVYTWTPQDLIPIDISITAVDDSGLAAPPLEVEIVLCSNCSGYGSCLYNETRETIAPLYHYALCVCDVGWTGDHCESDNDGCAGLPCSEDRNCTDLSAVEEKQFGRAFNCSPCPAGYSEVGQKCQDINECNETNICHQSCENTIGSYLCSCYDGYRLTGNLCIDINECTEGIHECEQECTNTDGNYTCSCVYGFELQSDGKSCTQVLNVCEINGLTCEYACDNNTVDGTYRCICPTGQKIKSNGSTCEDLDECTLSICPQKCNNTDGSFDCSCFDGYTLESDKITCKPCEKRFWGPNCANECQCGIGEDRCDASRGCICLSGYTGVKCDEDVNECIVNPGICSINETCNNTYGSYICSCLPGYERKSDGNCENTDECASEILNNCTTLISDCDNNVGSFTCKCKEGYNQLNPYECVDINECTSGSHSCEQLCDNVDGSYNCDCEIGFRLNNDRKSCEKDFEPCTNLNCSYGCKIDNGTAFCFCKDGYRLDTDGTSCIDINECSNDTLNSCSYKGGCSNTNGSYTCACPEGYFLENDGRTCSECDIFHWGPNCKYACNCGRGASHCDNINGCQCLTGWNGTTCASDINECDDDPCSGQNEDCFNTLGSYVCRCKAGYRNQSGICENIDECLENTHSCDQTCTDTDGTYNCSCNAGFTLYDDGKCQDINECETDEHKCDQRCDNTVGSYRCSCNEGYTLDNTNRYQCHGSSSETSSLSSTVGTKTISAPLSTMYKMDTSSTFSTSFDDMERSSMPDFPSSVTLNSFQTDQLSTILASSSDDVISSTSVPPTTSLERSTLFSMAAMSLNSSEDDFSSEVSRSSPQTEHSFSSSVTTTNILDTSTSVLSVTATPTEKTTYQALESTDYSQQISSILPSVTESDYITTQSTLKAESAVLSSRSSIGLDLSTSFSSTTTLESRSMETSSTEAIISSSEQTSSSRSIASSSELTTSSSQIVTTTTPKPADEKIITYSVIYTLDINVAASLTVQWSTAYNETFTKVHTSLTMFYSTQFGGSFKEVRLKSIRKGSLIAEHDLILKEEQQDNLIQVIADLLTDKVKLTYDNQQTSVTSISYTDGKTEKTATTENITQAACEIYVSLKPCENDYTCQLIDGVPKCRVIPTQDNSLLAVVVSVSVAVALLLMIIVTMIVLLYRRNKLKTARTPTSGPKRNKQLPKKFTREWPNAADNRGYLGDSFERDTSPYTYTTRVSREDNTYQRSRNAYSNIGGVLFNQWQDWFTADDLSDYKIRRPHVNLLPEPKPDY